MDVYHRSGAYQAVSHILRTGRWRMAIFTGLRNILASPDRNPGYLDAMHERAIPVYAELTAGVISDTTGYLYADRPDRATRPAAPPYPAAD